MLVWFDGGMLVLSMYTSECCVVGFVVTKCAFLLFHIAMVVDCVSNHRDILCT